MSTPAPLPVPALWLLDGNALIYRAYYAPFRDLSSPGGEPTRATYVFTQFLMNLLANERPAYLAMCMDVGDRETFRSEIYPDYKAHRPPPPEDLVPQRERILDIVHAFGIPILRVPGFEADDILATLAERYGCIAECGMRNAELSGQESGGGTLSTPNSKLKTQNSPPPPDLPLPLRVILVSRDKDLRQLLNDRVVLYDPNDKKGDPIVTPARLQAELGYGPQEAVEVQTLCGDSTDNVPGVKGVGEKTAVKLIAKYGTAAAVLAAAGEQTPALGANLKAFAPDMERTRRLVTLRRDVPVDFDLAQARWTGVDAGRVLPLYQQLGFHRLAADLERLVSLSPPSPASPANGSSAPPTTRPAEASPPRPGTAPSLTAKPTTAQDACYTLVDTPEKLAALARRLAATPVFAFDTETTAFACRELQLAGISISFEPLTGFYVPVETVPETAVDTVVEGDLFAHRHPAGGPPPAPGPGIRLPLRTVQQQLGPLFADPALHKVAHNAKFDLLALRAAGIEVAGLTFDTMLASYCLNPANRHGLKDLGRELLNHHSIAFADVTRRGKEELRFDQVPTDQACLYSAEDADVTWRLYLYFQKQLASEPVLNQLLTELEVPLAIVLADMEWQGVRLDVKLLERISAKLGEQLEELTKQIHALAGRPFLINSTKQLAEVLFDQLQLPVIRKTKTGRSTDAEVLEELAYRLETGTTAVAEAARKLPELLLNYRELYKLRSTYLEPLVGFVDPQTKRVHARFNQTGAETGRLSCSDPNLQNIPIRTDLGREIRAAFIPGEKDWVILSADYSQIELRLLAHLSGDRNLRAAFDQGADIHAYVASQVFKVPLAEVTKEQRSRAKAVNFGIVYGQTAYGLARSLKIANEVADAFIRAYQAQYPGIVDFLERCAREAGDHGFVRTILGRRRWIEGITDQNANRQAQARRLAINTVVQGSAADLIKQAMVNIHRRLRAEQRPSRLLIQVHDELVFETPAAAVGAEADMIRREMEHAFELDVPLRVDLAWGPNWKEGK